MDITLVLDTADLSIDWLMAAGDLATDEGLKSAVLISVFTDRLAAADDEIPDGSDDRRGFWGDSFPDPSAPGADKTDLIGSRFWLLERERQTVATLRRAKLYGEECLKWMIDDGIAQSIVCTPSYPRLGWIALLVVISRREATGRVVDHRFDLAWQATLGG